MFRLKKYHALGNDYFVLDPEGSSAVPSGPMIQRICHRHFGPGSDGILYGPLPEKDGFGLRIFNPDGSEAEKSGNGLRIFARFLFDSGRVGNEPFQVFTPGGKVKCVVENPRWIHVEMGKLNFLSSALPVTGPSREILSEPLEIDGETLKISCASIGNPHCVIVEDTISSSRTKALGAKLEHHPLFPNRTNVQFVKIIDRNTIQIEIWERGAGYTLASGSSSCAAAGVSHKLGLVDRDIHVKMPGGQIEIQIHDDFQMQMAGPVQAIGDVILKDEVFLD